MKLIGHSSIAYTQPIFSIGKKHFERLGGRERYFDPSHVSNMSAWYKADSIVGLNEGDLVTTWSDSSGSGHDLVQNTAGNKPTYHASGGGPNNLPSVEFVFGSSDYMSTSDIIISSAASISYAMYVKSPVRTLSNNLASFGTAFRLRIYTTADGIYWTGGGGTDITDNWRSGFSCNEIAKKPFFKNGFYLQYESNWSSGSNPDIASGTWYVGRTGSTHMGATLAELILYNASLDPYVYAPLFHQYFERKYGKLTVYS